MCKGTSTLYLWNISISNSFKNQPHVQLVQLFCSYVCSTCMKKFITPWIYLSNLNYHQLPHFIKGQMSAFALLCCMVFFSTYGASVEFFFLEFWFKIIYSTQGLIFFHQELYYHWNLLWIWGDQDLLSMRALTLLIVLDETES